MLPIACKAFHNNLLIFGNNTIVNYFRVRWGGMDIFYRFCHRYYKLYLHIDKSTKWSVNMHEWKKCQLMYDTGKNVQKT